MSYHSESTIEDQHRGTVNVLSFSGDGRFLATGCEDGIVKVFNTSGGGHRSTYEKEASAIDALIWNPRDSSSLCLYVGTRGGHVFSFQSPEQKNKNNTSKKHLTSLDGPIRCFTFDWNKCMIVGHGMNVTILKEDFQTCFILRRPEFPYQLRFENPVLRPTAIHVPRHNGRVIVSYLNHGVVCYSTDMQSDQTPIWKILPGNRIGRSAISEDGLLLAGTNLLDGIDFYTLGSLCKFRDHVTDTIFQNVTLPITFIDNDRAILVGSSRGVATIIDISSGKKTSLAHSTFNDLVQAAAYTKFRNTKYIATGISERTFGASVKIWKARSPPNTSCVRRVMKNARLPLRAFFIPRPNSMSTVAITMTCIAVVLACSPPLTLIHLAYLLRFMVTMVSVAIHFITVYVSQSVSHFASLGEPLTVVQTVTVSPTATTVSLVQTVFRVLPQTTVTALETIYKTVSSS